MGVGRKQNMALFLIIAAFCLILSACGSNDGQVEGELTVVNENGEEVSLTNKERATILFHFTEVG
ncbi:hypothetical protein N0O92_05130 [Alkalihalobacillus sp. MEB130]|uniref:hypothetical protein n=1 Tax=Alkalihalobacillus sp. MEB130 TaxID=2976704 RepID=UPI0028E019AA|nr:hypothetical protein [Alkalihalobacillus sp. MEB130]MDT8859609.1 hypothetical protein [Alkalihalobacillus sp. MEB130]